MELEVRKDLSKNTDGQGNDRLNIVLPDHVSTFGDRERNERLLTYTNADGETGQLLGLNPEEAFDLARQLVQVGSGQVGRYQSGDPWKYPADGSTKPDEKVMLEANDAVAKLIADGLTDGERAFYAEWTMNLLGRILMAPERL